MLIKIRGGVVEKNENSFRNILNGNIGNWVITPALQEAYAYPVKADNSEKLKPKSFGVKIKDKMPLTDSQNIKQNSFDGIKQEEVKAYKKIFAEAYAKQALKKLYKLGY